MKTTALIMLCTAAILLLGWAAYLRHGEPAPPPAPQATRGERPAVAPGDTPDPAEPAGLAAAPPIAARSAAAHDPAPPAQTAPPEERSYWDLYGVKGENPYASYDWDTVRALADNYDPLANEWLGAHLIRHGEPEAGQERIVRAAIYSGRWEPLVRMTNNFFSEYGEADIALKYWIVARELGAPVPVERLEVHLTEEQIVRNRQDAEALLARMKRERFELFGKEFPRKGEDHDKEVTGRGAARPDTGDRHDLRRAA